MRGICYGESPERQFPTLTHGSGARAQIDPVPMVSIESCISLRLAARLVPPFREALRRFAGVLGVVGGVVEEHEAGVYGVAEVEDVEAGGGLVEAVAVAAGVEAEEAAEENADGRLVGDDQDTLAGMLRDDG